MSYVHWITRYIRRKVRAYKSRVHAHVHNIRFARLTRTWGQPALQQWVRLCAGARVPRSKRFTSPGATAAATHITVGGGGSVRGGGVFPL